MQDNGDASQAAPAAPEETGTNSKKQRKTPASQAGAQAHTQISNEAGGSQEQAYRAHAAAAHRGSTSNGLARAVGAAHHQHTTAGCPLLGPTGQAPAASAVTRQQSSAQTAALELRQLKEKIAARQAQLQREQVQPHWPSP